ncbi:MAG: diguanylate cyclase [Burkholderiaceae bacterium]|nr:diguanylate cyclase [Ideonella sp.]MCC7285856.1 diguanylate cyclase [Burkholderiaceae bacterium]
MSRPGAASATSKGLRLARKAWQLLHQDSARSVDLARQALQEALSHDDAQGQAWARLAIGYHLLYFGTPAEARVELSAAQSQFERLDEQPGFILAGTGLARCLWREGRFAASLELVLPLREPGLQVLQHEQRGVLLNTIAGCYSAQGRSEQAFAYMYQALRDSGPTHGRGFDAVLYCNLAHELQQIGDYHEALRYLDQGISRCHELSNPRLLSVLLVNRIICLTELDRAQEAMLDVLQVRSLPTGPSGRGTMATGFETLAIAALRAGELQAGRELLELAQAALRADIPDEQVELAIASALLEGQQGRWAQALQALDHVLPLVGADDADAAEGLSLRVRCMYFLLRSEIHEQLGDAAQALVHMRIWQQLHVARAHLASRARYQAAALQTELMRLQHKLDEQASQRRRSERAKAELEAANAQLSNKIVEVQTLQSALKEQAVRDALTGLFNRRYLDEALPAALALAQREHQALAVAIIDLDHFKAVNDRYGHGTGDTLLAAFGRLLASHCRKSDIACRYGGEEFCLLLPRTDAATAQRKVSHLLALWRQQRFEIDGDALRGLSFSAGISDSIRAPLSAQMLLQAADRQLLAAKQRGRSRVLALGTEEAPH